MDLCRLPRMDSHRTLHMDSQDPEDGSSARTRPWTLLEPLEPCPTFVSPAFCDHHVWTCADTDLQAVTVHDVDSPLFGAPRHHLFVFASDPITFVPCPCVLLKSSRCKMVLMLEVSSRWWKANFDRQLHFTDHQGIDNGFGLTAATHLSQIYAPVAVALLDTIVHTRIRAEAFVLEDTQR